MKRLRKLRIEKGLTQLQIATDLGIHYSTYGKYELGHNDPDTKTLIKLADYFDVSADYLLGRTDIRQMAAIGNGNFDLPPEALHELESYKEYLRQKYGGK